MGLDDDGFLPRPPAPVRGAPRIGVVVDHLARAEDVIGLKRRRRIRHVDLVIDAEFVARTGFHAGDIGGEPAILAALHRVRLAPASRRRASPPAPTAETARRRCRQPGPNCRSLMPRPQRQAPIAAARWSRRRTRSSIGRLHGFGRCSAPAASSCIRASSGNLKAISSGAAFSTIKIGGCPCSSGPST